MRLINTIAWFTGELLAQGMAASESRVYLSAGGRPDAASRVVAFWCRDDVDWCSTGANFVLGEDDQAHELAVGNDLLFVIVLGEDWNGRIVALDAHTLEQRISFGSNVFHGSKFLEHVEEQLYSTRMRGMTVGGDHLYVGDTVKQCLHVFSMAGEHLREVRGDWWAAQQVLHFNGRLYLFECDPEDGLGAGSDDSDDNVDTSSVGKRIFALSMAGETLQVWRPQIQISSEWIYNMCIMGHRLIVRRGMSPSNLYFASLSGVRSTTVVSRPSSFRPQG